MTRVWLIRHGEPAAHAHGRCYGSLDVGLSESGRMQMALAGEAIRQEPIAAIYTSALIRAAESARILAGVLARGGPIEVVDDLREIDFGDFEGKSYDEIAREHPALFRRWMMQPTEVRFPNGESFGVMRARVLAAFERICREREGQTVVIVSHGGVNRALLAWALEMPDGALFRLAQDYAACSLITVVEGIPAVERMNCRGSIGGAGSNRTPE